MFWPFPMFVCPPVLPISDKNRIENFNLEERIEKIANILSKQENRRKAYEILFPKLYKETIKIQLNWAYDCMRSVFRSSSHTRVRPAYRKRKGLSSLQSTLFHCSMFQSTYFFAHLSRSFRFFLLTKFFFNV